MIALTGLLRTIPAESFWGRFQPNIELGPHQAAWVLAERDLALRRVEISGADVRTVVAEAHCHTLIVTRDFGIRLTTPCRFAGGLAGAVETEVRLRCLDQAADLPRWLSQGRSEAVEQGEGRPERQLARLIAGLFEAELARSLADQNYPEVRLRLNDPVFVNHVEAQVRAALARWTDERVLGLVAVHLLKVDSPEGERRERSESEAQGEQARLEREHRLRVLAAKQAAELAALQPAPPADHSAPPKGGARPPGALAPTAPSDSITSPRLLSLAERQLSVQRALDTLAGAQPAAIRVRLLARSGPPSGSVADLARSIPESSPLLRLNDEIHVVVESPVDGFLHVFNLGSSGQVTLLIPEHPQQAVSVAARQAYLVSTGSAIAPLESAGGPISPWIEQGPLNGYPERILAVVTATDAPLSAGDLHPAWAGGHGSARPMGTGFGAPQIETSLSGQPQNRWCWGWAEAGIGA